MNENTNKILAFAQSLPDHRINRKKLHTVEDIAFITLAAVICGADTWESIADFGTAKYTFLKKHIALENGIPSHDTFNRFFSLLKPEVFESYFIEWVKAICSKTKGVVAIDGKTVRGSNTLEKKSAIHMVSAFCSANNLVLGQVKTTEKSNEITAIPELLKILDLEGCIVTIDAMGCQTKIAENILEQKADYILAVKENQKGLLEGIQDAFLFAKKADMFEFKDLDIGHGRVETRICTVVTDLSYIENSDKWPKLTTLIKIDSERYTKSTKTNERETRYYISSLEPNPKLIGQSIREHWSIENQLHWHLDVSFNEDKSRKRYQNAAENYSIILRMALTMVKKESSVKKSVARKRLQAGWDNEYLMNIMAF